MAQAANSPFASWQAWRPSKTLWVWSCIGSCIATVIVGFTWGGWVTAGSSAAAARMAARSATAQLAATFCVGRFEHAADAQAELALLKQTQDWARDEFIRKGGWATPPGAAEPVPGAASLCAEQLLKADLSKPGKTAS